MRNILKFLIIGVFAIMVSCDNLNEFPEFNDGDAFVAFNNSSLAVSEDGTSLNIPVTLASINGMSASVTYTIIDGTATKGVEFTVADASQSLSFDAENRTQNIVVNIVDNPDVFTGDLTFQIQLSEDGIVKPDAQNICTVTIKDLDHPLSRFFGDWKASGIDKNSGAVTWDVFIEKDPEDVTVLWFQNLTYGFGKYGYTYANGYDNRYYGIVNDEGVLTIPTGQACVWEYTEGTAITLYALDMTYGAVDTDLIPTISEDGSVITFVDYGPGASGYYSWGLHQPGMTLTKI